ncbi:MAG: pinensin family lanthipeptide [Acidobacteriota bacterium]|nr:pinensin family lanthipeptide [Acidobacteriota bacterium]
MNKKIKLDDIKITSFVTNAEAQKDALRGGSGGRACPSAYTCETECFACTGAYCTHPYFCG